MLTTRDTDSTKWKESLINKYIQIYLDYFGDVWITSSYGTVKWLNNSSFNSSTKQLTKNPHLKNIEKILGGSDDTYFFGDNQDRTWVIGCSYFGQAGIGKAVTISSSENRKLWKKQCNEAGTFASIIPNLKWSEIASLVCHQSTFIKKTDGTVLACGRNDGEQLQLGHSNICSTLTPVPYLKNAQKIWTEYLKCCFTLEDGTEITYENNPDITPIDERKIVISSSTAVLFPKPTTQTKYNDDSPLGNTSTLPNRI